LYTLIVYNHGVSATSRKPSPRGGVSRSDHSAATCYNFLSRCFSYCVQVAVAAGFEVVQP
jgi:hypothetical protein